MNFPARNLLLVIAVALGAVSLGGCGFHPLYGNASTGSSLGRTLSSIYVEPVTDYGVGSTGYELRNALLNGLDSNKNGRYRLKMTLNIQTQGLALLTNASVTRYNDTLTVKYTLTDSETGQVIKQGTEIGRSAYNVASSPYATLIAQQDSDKRAVQDVAERLRIQLGVFFEQKRKLSLE